MTPDAPEQAPGRTTGIPLQANGSDDRIGGDVPGDMQDGEIEPADHEGGMRAWVAMLHAYARIIATLSADLERAGKVPLGTYDVLFQLNQAGGRLRQRDLGDKVLLSQPGLSRKVVRLAEAGLVERHAAPDDGRGVVIALSRAGKAALRTASVVHLSGIDHEFIARLSADEAAVLATVFERLSTPPAD